MKLAETIETIELSENLQMRSFRIKANAHSFRRLYGDLYSYAVQAIIRELSTNAADAHVTAGKADVPFEVHLPNELEPFFYVKDWGTGLSPDQVAGENGIYITFFESDKSDSNDFTGCLGLGSKSPFAYIDNFTVESRYNGQKYLYACLHNEKGEPCIAPMGAVPTDEPNGLKVEFAVKAQDFDQFYRDAEYILSWFKNRPNVVGYGNFKFKEYEYLRRADRYGVTKENSQSYVIMGNVAYPLDSGDLYYNKITNIEREVIDHGVHLFVDIGDVEFVPSREKLKMSNKTIEGIKKYLGDAIHSIQEELVSQVQLQPSIWKARCMLHNIKHSILGKVREITTVPYNGTEISEYVKFKKKLKRDANGLPIRDALGELIYEPSPVLEVIHLKKERYGRRYEDTLYCDGKNIYFIDIERGSHARILKHLHDHNVKSAYIISNETPEHLVETGIGEVVIRASSLPQPERQKREKLLGNGMTTYVKRTVLQEYYPLGSKSIEYWKDVDVDLRDGGVYVMISYGQVVEGEKKTVPEDIAFRYNLIRQIDPNFKLYGIRPAHLGRMGRYQLRWIKFEDYVRKLLKQHEHLKDKMALAAQQVSYPNRWNLFMEIHFEYNSNFGKLIDKFREVKEAKDDKLVSAFKELNNLYGVVEMPTISNEVNDMENSLDNTYSLLDDLDWHKSYRPQFIQGVIDYIYGVDDRLNRAIPLKEVV